LSLPGTTHAASNEKCADYREGELNLYWGDLHVHSAYSLDAYAFGTTADPGDAYAFARGQELTLPDKTTRIKLRRPLDFAAITDHAETFDVMYLCTDPNYLQLAYCKDLRSRSGTDSSDSRYVFKSFLLPLIAGKKPKPSPICDESGIDCSTAAQLQWRRVQQYANQANSPCEFTAFIGNEWSATPNDQHWHRNLIFAGTSVTEDAIDYIRFPSPQRMWNELEKQCKPEQGCDVIAIPHNTNLSEGGGFDVESSPDTQRRLRAKYERLIEIHQSKGNSECLMENWDNSNSDCGFEQFIPASVRERIKSEPKYIDQMNRSYARNILSRGLIAYEKSSDQRVNPLQLGFIGSTDDHVATPGAVDESNWKGDAWGAGDKFKQRRFKRLDYNPGGLVAVWSEENTRKSLFASLKRREVYGTSGTRIKLRFLASITSDADFCSENANSDQAIAMGGSFTRGGQHPPRFSVIAAQDSVPLSQIEIIKGTVKAGKIIETVYPLHKKDATGFAHTCRTWSDPDYDPSRPAYWYTRVFEIPTPRWSKALCENLSNCDKHPGADAMIQERAWSSPIWYLP
ncbi:MAG: DUF3604 domain-containing protein, partial [Pseudomonadales bacterium]